MALLVSIFIHSHSPVTHNIVIFESGFFSLSLLCRFASRQSFIIFSYFYKCVWSEEIKKNI